MKCLVPECVDKPKARGLCVNHYNYASTLVCRGKTTWKQLEDNGTALPVKSARTNTLREWFLTKKKK